MDKETYIYNHLKDFVSVTTTRNDMLEKIAEWVYIEFQVNIYFCEIKGKRWSFIAGRKHTVYVPVQIPINSKLGIIAEENSIQENTWQALIRVLNILQEEGVIA